MHDAMMKSLAKKTDLSPWIECTMFHVLHVLCVVVVYVDCISIQWRINPTVNHATLYVNSYLNTAEILFFNFYVEFVGKMCCLFSTNYRSSKSIGND